MNDSNEIVLSLDNDIDLKLGDNLVLGNLDYINIGKIITSTLMSGIEASVSIKNRYDPSISRYVTDFDFKIPQGIKGDRGEQGIQGEKGDQGIQGIQGIQGEKGIKGDQGIQGEKGEKGDVGPKGTSVTGVSLNGLNFNFNFSDGTSKKVPLNTNDTATCTEINITNEVTQDSDDLVTSGGVYTAINTHSSNNSNPHNVTKEQVGLGNVDNTSDLDKPISTATQSALDEKLNTSNVVQTIGTSETDVMSQKAVTEALSNASGLKRGQTKWVTTTTSTSHNIHSLTGSSFFSLNLSTNNGRYTSSATESTYEAGAKTAITFINPSISYTDSSGETKTFSCSHLKSELIYVGETPLVGSSNNAKIISLKGQLVYAIIPSVGNYNDDIRIDFLFKRVNTSSSYQISNIKAIVNHTDAIYNAETSSFTYVSTSEDVSTSIKIMSQRLEVVQYYLY